MVFRVIVLSILLEGLVLFSASSTEVWLVCLPASSSKVAAMPAAPVLAVAQYYSSLGDA